MNKTKLTYLAIANTLAFSSCQEEQLKSGDVDPSDSRVIAFQAFLPSATASRGSEMVKDKLDSLQVTAFYIEESTTTPYFQNEKFRKKSNGYYSPARIFNCFWPENKGNMEFYAHYPQLENFAFSGKYSIDTIRVASDISRHVDFLTANAKASIPDLEANVIDPVKLQLKHRLSRIRINAKLGSNAKYAFEIAGIRLGNPVVEGKFIFADPADSKKDTTWDLSNAKQGCVQYVFNVGDTLVSLKPEEHSLMGIGGNAMVIPAEIAKWERPADPTTVATPYSTNQMYFSVLLRVTKQLSSNRVYPYPDDSKHPGMKVIYLSVDQENRIIANVDKDYIAKDGETVKEFGWAAVPVDVKWLAGHSYLYSLDYSNGIGYHDPEDPAPGTPIG